MKHTQKNQWNSRSDTGKPDQHWGGAILRLTTACAVAAAALICSSGFSEALAYCSEPSFSESEPSSPPSSSRPNVPYCLSEYGWSGAHDCDDWEIDSYQSDVREYISDLENYADEVRRFAEEAIGFANEASQYVNCEAEDVATQHQ